MSRVLNADLAEEGIGAPARKAKLLLLYLCLAFLLVTHGGTGYYQSKALLLLGMVLLSAVSGWWLAAARLITTRGHMLIVLATICLMFPAAALGALVFDTKSGFTFIVVNLLSFLVFALLLRRYSEDGVTIICRAFILTALISFALAILVTFQPIQIGDLRFGRDGYFRLVGTFSTPNRFGEVPAAGVLACLYLFVRRPSDRFRIGIVTVLLVGATLGSGSKGVILGVFAALGVVVAFSDIARKTFFWRAAAVLLPAIGLTVYHFFDYILLATKLDQIQEGSLDVGSGRPVIWAMGTKVFLSAHPLNQLFGHGTSAFINKVGADAHSTYWGILVDYGAVALAAIAGLLLYLGVLLTTYRANRHKVVFAASLIVFCLARGVAMPTILDGFNFAALAFWAGVAILFTPSKKSDKHA